MRARTLVLCVVSGLTVACSSGSDAPPPPAAPTLATVNSASQSGDVLMSGNVGVSGGKLTLTLAAIRDPDNASQPANPANVTFNVRTGEATATAAAATRAGVAQIAAPSLLCSVGAATASSAMADIVFINDTTGSMAGTVTGIADSIGTFATAIAAAVDARFSMYTYGDAFATRAADPDSEFTLGRGDFPVPVGFDDFERPYVALGGLAGFTPFLTELKAATALGNGGADEPENTIGTIDYANSHLAFRPGAAKVFVVIGDNPSHQEGDGDVASWPAEYRPTTGANLVSRLGGACTLHVVGNDTTYGAYYNLKLLADATGGVFKDLPSDGVVDLTTLNVQAWLTNSFSGGCTSAPAGRYLVIVDVSVVGSGGTTRTGTLTFDLTVS